jgi:uncharacterized protein (DUF362 family)
MVSRRKFLTRSAAATVVSGAYFTGRVYAQGSADIGVATGDDIDAAVRSAVASVGGMESYVKSGDRVIVKPNLSFASPAKRAATTNPETLASVIRLCLEAGAKEVLVVDHPLQDAAIIGDKADVAKAVIAIDGATLLLPTTEVLYKKTPIPRGKEMKETAVALILDEADVLINLPVAKSHSATGVSFGIKGNLGLVYDRIAYHNSGDFIQTIADLATIITPDLTIIDAVRALTTRGPQGPGKVAELGTIVAGPDPVAVDSYAVTLTPWYNREILPQNVPHLVKAAELGVGEIDLSKLDIVKNSV